MLKPFLGKEVLLKVLFSLTCLVRVPVCEEQVWDPNRRVIQQTSNPRDPESKGHLCLSLLRLIILRRLVLLYKKLMQWRVKTEQVEVVYVFTEQGEVVPL